MALEMRPSLEEKSIEEKGTQDFVTAADRAIEKFLKSRILRTFPEDGVLGEENGVSKFGEALWIVDPIDGTTNYIRGLPEWGISIARLEGGIVTHGVIELPDLRHTAWARKGAGAFLDGKKLDLGQRDLGNCRLAILGYSQHAGVTKHLKLIEKLISLGFEYRRHGAACFGLVSVANGWADMYHEYHLKAWDALAGMLIVSEAGGNVISDPVSDFLLNGSSITATNAAIDVQEALKTL